MKNSTQAKVDWHTAEPLDYGIAYYLTLCKKVRMFVRTGALREARETKALINEQFGPLTPVPFIPGISG